MTNKTVKIRDIIIGSGKPVVIAGPCTVESREQILDVASFVKEQGALLLRGGAWKQRTSPHSFRGLGDEGLAYLEEARDKTGLPVVTEITNPDMVELYYDRIDCFQIGAKNMQNFDLLIEIGKTDKPVLLKNNPAATYEEFINAAGYITKEGNPNVIMCYRGIRTFETMTRYTFDMSSIPILKRETDLPVIADPSHAAGDSSLVETLAVASTVSGADGLIVEVHNNPKAALCDGEQSLDFQEFASLMESVKKYEQYIR